MTTYKIKLVSQTNAIVFIIVGMLIFFVSAIKLLPSGGLQNDGLAILIVLILSVVAYFLWQIFVTGRTIWTIDDNGIKVVWTKEFFWTYNDDDTIRWNEIKDISRGMDPQYYNLKIELFAGYTIKYFHDTLTTRDDFEEMLKVLYQTFNEKRKSSQHKV